MFERCLFGPECRNVYGLCYKIRLSTILEEQKHQENYTDQTPCIKFFIELLIVQKQSNSWCSWNQPIWKILAKMDPSPSPKHSVARIQEIPPSRKYMFWCRDSLLEIAKCPLKIVLLGKETGFLWSHSGLFVRGKRPRVLGGSLWCLCYPRV